MRWMVAALLLGFSWYGVPRDVRPAMRSNGKPTNRLTNMGLRAARDLDGNSSTKKVWL